MRFRITHKSLPVCLGVLGWLVGLAVSPQAAIADDEYSEEQLAFFETKIRPVLTRDCYGCHSQRSGKAQGGLRLDTKEATLMGGDTGPAVVPGDLEESLLWAAINYDTYQMPPDAPLSDAVIHDFREWIEMGAADPRATGRLTINTTITAKDINEAKENFWAYQSPQVIAPASMNDSDWSKTEIDRYIWAELEQANMQPSEDADPYTVLRRLTFDLVGLPPSESQIASFLRQWRSNPDRAIALVVDELLESDRFGERWGRHWLDVARYAESTGKELNATFPHAWRYRDYVIDSFNDDKPFDRFLKEQLAGDLLPVNTDEQWSENLIATTFLAVGAKTLSEQDGRQFQADLLDEQIDATTRVFLATSVACARCHDHKFDPIPQTDYYAMAGIFQSMETYYGTIGTQRNRRRSSILELPVFDEQTVSAAMDPQEFENLKQALSEAQAELEYVQNIRRRVIFLGQTGPDLPDKDDPILTIGRVAMLGQQVADLEAQLAKVDEDGQPIGKCMGVQESRNIRDATLYVRGELDQPGPVVPRGTPQVLSSARLRISRRSSGRLELAEWMASEDNPLTARVMANRVWKYLIGEGIVRTTENFGATGDLPTHPELLDFLAIQFVESDWSIKQLIREITTSRVYRISSEFNEEYFELDPENKLLWRTTPRRLEAEAIRDALLYVSEEIEMERPVSSLIAKAGDGTVSGNQISVDDPSAAGGMQAAGGRGGGQFGGGMRGGNGQGFGGQGFGGQGFGGRSGAGGMQGGGQQGRGGRGRGGNNGMRGGMAGGGMGGPGMGGGRGRGNSISLDVPDDNHRSVYMPIVRNFAPRSLGVFDFPDPTLVIGDRYESNTPNQALFMLNNPLVIRTSESLAQQLRRQERDQSEQLKAAFLRVYGRPATDGELDDTRAYLAMRRGSGNRASAEKQLALVCQALFATAEFRYRY